MGKISMQKLSWSFARDFNSGLGLKRWTQGQGARSLRLKFPFKAPSHTGKQQKMFPCLMKNRPPTWDVRCSAHFMDFDVFPAKPAYTLSSRVRGHTVAVQKPNFRSLPRYTNYERKLRQLIILRISNPQSYRVLLRGCKRGLIRLASINTEAGGFILSTSYLAKYQ